MEKKKKDNSFFPRSTQGRWRGQFASPTGTISATREELQQAGCINAEDATMFAFIMQKTANNPCNGCGQWHSDGPACKAFQAHHSAYKRFLQSEASRKAEQKEAVTPHNAPEGHPFAKMNMKQIAEALGISKNEAVRRKQAGTLLTAQPSE